MNETPDSNEWAFDPEWITLNNGSFGGCPASVRAVEAEWRARLDAQPTRFMHAELPALLRAAAAHVAEALSADADDLVLVENATAACNAVLRSQRFKPGDEILLFDQAYGAVRRTVEFVTREAGARIVDVALPFPDTEPARVVAAVASAIGPRTVLAVVDHVTSPGALVLPIKDLVTTCHARAVRVLVDGAHAPGQVPVDLAAIGADWYAGNLHKWFLAPTGTAFLHARKQAQAGLHPIAISHGLDRGFSAEFDWTGTRDFSGWLAAPAALALHARLGGDALMARNAARVRAGAAHVAGALGTEAAHGCLPGAMALVRVPDGHGTTIETALALRERLIAARIDVPVVCLAGALWLRLSVHACTAADAFERLAARLPEVFAKFP